MLGNATNRSLGCTSLEGLRTSQQDPPHLQELLEVPNFNFPEGTTCNRTERTDNLLQYANGPLQHPSSRADSAPRVAYGDYVEGNRTGIVLNQSRDLKRDNQVPDRRPTQVQHLTGNNDSIPRRNQRDNSPAVYIRDGSNIICESFAFIFDHLKHATRLMPPKKFNIISVLH